jgi:hypothetical protein
MSTLVPKNNPLASVMVAQLKMIAERVGAGSSFHLDPVSSAITASNASDLATSLTLCKQIVGVYLTHLDNDAAHKLKDPKPSVTVESVVSLATAITAANTIKGDYNTHRASTTYHYNADGTNVTSASDATDQSSLNTLLNELKTDLNAHLASGPTGALAQLVDA